LARFLYDFLNSFSENLFLLKEYAKRGRNLYITYMELHGPNGNGGNGNGNGNGRGNGIQTYEELTQFLGHQHIAGLAGKRVNA
jgi:hypothetical protein